MYILIYITPCKYICVQSEAGQPGKVGHGSSHELMESALVPAPAALDPAEGLDGESLDDGSLIEPRCLESEAKPKLCNSCRFPVLRC